ncbi:hypothetical protein Tco_1105808 [Tanacetum coccineum]
MDMPKSVIRITEVLPPQLQYTYGLQPDSEPGESSGVPMRKYLREAYLELSYTDTMDFLFSPNEDMEKDDEDEEEEEEEKHIASADLHAVYTYS